MKLLHVISSLEIGGAQRLLSDLLPLQKQQGIEVAILVNIDIENAFTKKIKEAGIEIICLDDLNLYSVRNIFRMRKIFKGYDIIHAHLFPAIYWVACASVGLNLKLVYTEHSTSNRRRGKFYFRPVEKLIYHRYDKIISISKQTQDALQQWLQATDEKFVVINNGVDMRHFSLIHRPITPKSLIMVSRFTASKDQETVIRAMQYIDKEATLRFVGDGDNLEHCKQVAKECRVEDRVKFLGTRSDVADLIAESYIGIQSSNWEGFGLTAVEMMACGKPVIATDVDGLKQVVEGAGLIFHRGDSKELATNIFRLLDCRDYYDSVSKKCKDRSLLYDISAMADRYRNVYYELTKD